MARTAGDLVLLDSIIRNSAANTTGNGAVANALSCSVKVNTSMSLAGVRLGLPSTEGWVPSATYDGISGEVGHCTLLETAYLLLVAPCHYSLYGLHAWVCIDI